MADNLKVVKITPWQPAVGCLCHLAVTVSKDVLAYVTPTGDKHACCGKVLRVVELHFKEGQKINIEDLFTQLAVRMQVLMPEHASNVESTFPYESSLDYEPRWPYDRPMFDFGLRRRLPNRPPPRRPPPRTDCSAVYDDCWLNCMLYTHYPDCDCVCHNVVVHCRHSGTTRQCA